MFPFFPYFGPFGFPFYNRPRVRTLMGIPVLKTTGVSASTTAVSYTVNDREFFSLPKEGVFFLEVKQSSPTASATLPVTLSEGDETTTANSLLKSGLQENVPASDLVLNGRYLIYYNRCTNNYQLINSYPAAATTPTT